jgi:aminopeptidase-like protein
MAIGELLADIDLPSAGEQMYARIAALYPICRSITGNGVRQTLQIIDTEVPLAIHEVPTGTRVFDWAVPNEWNVRSAWVKAPDGRTVIDFSENNLHLVSYSVPVHAHMSLADLKPHLHTLPDQPTLTPYRTGYYAENWGFCLPHERLQRFAEGTYEVCIDSTLSPGHLTYGECFLQGDSSDEILISVHVCHPSLCNDNLSGITVAMQLALALRRCSRRYSYRFLFIPATIGAITWLSRNEGSAARIKHGLVLACVGDRGTITYKKSRRGNAEIDRAVALVLAQSREAHEIRDFTPWGYDERQYSSPGFNLPVGLLSRTPHGEFPEYHTSADDLSFVSPDALAATFMACLETFEVLEHNRRFVGTNQKCEPQLGRRGIYRMIAGQTSTPDRERAMLWLLNLSDGSSSLLDIAERSRLPFRSLMEAAGLLERHGLLVSGNDLPVAEAFSHPLINGVQV